MATYGGGINFVSSDNTQDLSGSTTSVLITVADNKYVDFKPLAFNKIAFSNPSATTAFTVQHSDGAGGWLNTATTVSDVGGNTTGTFTVEWRLHPGQRVVAASTPLNPSGYTSRFVYSYVEYESAT